MAKLSGTISFEGLGKVCKESAGKTSEHWSPSFGGGRWKVRIFRVQFPALDSEVLISGQFYFSIGENVGVCLKAILTPEELTLLRRENMFCLETKVF